MPLDLFPGRRPARAALAALLVLFGGAACDAGGPSDPGVEPVASVRVSPGDTTLAVGQELVLTAAAHAADGRVLPGRPVEWHSSDVTVAAVSPQGRVRALRPGAATVVATSEGRSAGARVLVAAPAPPPAVTELAPASGAAGAAALVLTVRGARFTADSRVHWNGAERPTTFVGEGELQAAIPAADLAAAGAASVTVVVPGNGAGSTSNAVTFAILDGTPGGPAPVAELLSPASAAAGGPGFTLTVRGRGFRPGLRVHWNGRYRPTLFVSETEARAEIAAADLAEVASAEVRVVDTQGGGPSNPLPFQVVPQTVPVQAVEVRPAVVVTRVGGPAIVSATPRDGAGDPLSGRLVTWTSSDHRVALVDGAGRVTAVGLGEAVVTAASEGRTATAVVQVTPQAYDLLLDGGAGLTLVDMRLGGLPSALWSHGSFSAALDPSPSPDRRHVAYVHASTGSIAVLDRWARTYRFAGAGDQPAWSPGGDRIAFRSTRGGRADVWTMAPDGTGEVNLTAGGPEWMESESPAWSPAGDRIAFSRRNAQGGMDLWTMAADGTDRRQLTISLDRFTGASWSPDGRWIAFTAVRPDGSSDVWRIQRDGSGLQRLTTTGRAAMPAWSPDGRWIAFVQRTGSAPRGDVLAMRLDGSGVRPLTLVSDGPGGGGANPAWIVR